MCFSTYPHSSPSFTCFFVLPQAPQATNYYKCVFLQFVAVSNRHKASGFKCGAEYNRHESAGGNSVGFGRSLKLRALLRAR